MLVSPTHPSWRRVPCALFLLVFLPVVPMASQAQEPEPPPARADLPILVLESGTERPLPGAMVRIPELGLQLAAGPNGLVNFRGIPAGRHEVVVEQLGYLTVRFPIAAPRMSPFRISVSPAAISLDEILVETDNALGLGARRRAIPIPVEVLRSEDLAFAGPQLMDALEDRDLPLVPCPEMMERPEESARYCTRFEARWVRPMLCIDERWLPANPVMLNRYLPRDMHTLELYRGGSGPSVIILGYTHEFVARSLETGRTLSWIVSCAGDPDPPDPWSRGAPGQRPRT